MRPKSIVTFERLYLGALALGIVDIVLSWQETSARLAADPRARDLGSTFLPMTVLISVIIPLLLWYFVARKASVVAKWIVVALFVLSIAAFLIGAQRTGLPSGLSGILSLVAVVMQAAAVWLLFRPDAKAWFNDGRGGSETDSFR